MSQSPILPDLFVIGAAKAASSSLQRWLGDHPEIGVTKIDEARFLMDAEDPLARPNGYAATGLAGYEAFFPPELRPDGTRHLLDVTPMYYYQRTAGEVIPTLPGAQVIFLARRPGARLKSLYDYAQHNIGVLPAGITFADFVAEVEKGPASQVVGQYPMMCYGIEHCKYSFYLRDWIERLGRDKVHIMIFEDLVKAPQAEMARLAGELGIAADFYDSYGFPRVNESYAVRNRSLHQIVRSLKKRLPAPVRQRLSGSYAKINTPPKATGPLSPADANTMAYVDNLLAPWEQELAELIGRPTVWSAPSS